MICGKHSLAFDLRDHPDGCPACERDQSRAALRAQLDEVNRLEAEIDWHTAEIGRLRAAVRHLFAAGHGIACSCGIKCPSAWAREAVEALLSPDRAIRGEPPE